MLPCHKKCAYKENIPGDCHISCTFNWNKINKEDIPKNKHGRKTMQWFIFPYNFDPVWGPDKCVGYNTELDPENKKKMDPMESLISLLGKRVL